MRIHNLPAWLAGAILFLPVPVHAEAAAHTLHAAVEQAWQRSPLARTLEGRQNEAAAGHALAQSWLAGAPTLGLSERSGRWTGRSEQHETEIALAAPILLPGQQSARRQLAAASVGELQARLRQGRLDIAGAVRARLWEAAAAREMLAEKEGHLHHLEELRADVKRRVQAGDMARSDGLLAEQEVLAAQGEVAAARSRAREALNRFRLLTGMPELPALEPELLPEAEAAAIPGYQTGAASDAVPSVRPGVVQGAVPSIAPGVRPGVAPGGPAGGTGGPQAEQHVRLRAAQAAEQRARAAVGLASSSVQGAPTVSLSMRRERDGAFASPERSVGIAVQIPLGGKLRNRPAEARAATELATASAELAETQAAIGIEAAQARARLGDAFESLQAALARVAAMREHTALLQKAFNHGERGLAELLRSRTLAHEAEVGLRQQRVALGLAHAQLNQALGILP